eukprot:scaffold17036_cov119-Isochrysis_galbana.AAC.3
MTESRLVPTECFDELSAQCKIHFIWCENLCGRSTSHPTSLLPAAAGVRSSSMAPPAGSGHILQGAHLATVPQSYIRTTA